jgi:two-component system, OmpR family, sensor histidine kinase BaeS
MKIGIIYRLFFSILSATGLAILSLFLIMQWSIDRGFYQYLGTMDQSILEQVVNELGQKYAEQGNWDFLKTSPPRWGAPGLAPQPDRDAPRPSFFDRGGPGLDRHPPMPPHFEQGRPGDPLIILNAEKKAIMGSYPEDEEVNFRPIIVRGETVGYAGLLSPKHFLLPMQVRFLSQQKLALGLAAAGMVLVVIIISFPLSRRLVGPIRAIAAATRDIASGNYATRIHVSSSDELGQLAHDFNDMALTLEKHNKDQRQWVADISHELRTPVAVLRGEIEALLDGIRPITPETVRSLHAEALRLGRLVEDLYQLSLSDIGALSYRKEFLDVADVLNVSLDGFRAEFGRKNITLRADLSVEQKVVAYGDRGRLEQLFANLFENSLRYTDAGGEAAVSLALSDSHIIIEFQDSAPGVSERNLDRLFERLYRVEGSRSRTSGGAGLGLAICKNIVEAHEGSISAHQSSLGGLLVRISLPLARRGE